MSSAEQALADAMTARWGATLGRFDDRDARDVLGFLKGYRLVPSEQVADRAEMERLARSAVRHFSNGNQTHLAACLYALQNLFSDPDFK